MINITFANNNGNEILKTAKITINLLLCIRILSCVFNFFLPFCLQALKL